MTPERAGARDLEVLKSYAAASQRKATTRSFTACDDCGKPLAAPDKVESRADAFALCVDYSKHECGCEFCLRSALLCPATQSSIIEELTHRHDECCPTELDHEEGGRIVHWVVTWGGVRFYLTTKTDDGRSFDVNSTDDVLAQPELGAACDYLQSWLMSRAEE